MAASSATRYGSGSKGVGWGGPAKGAGSSAPSFTESLENRIEGAVTLSPVVRMAKAEREALRADQAEAVKDEIYRIATKGERESDRVNAGVAFLNRIEGAPLQRVHNENRDVTEKTEGELQRELDAITSRSGAGGHSRAGDSEEAGSA